MTKVKVLFLGADLRNDAHRPRLRIDEEMREIVQKVRASEFRDALDFTWRSAVRADDLLQALNEVRPEVVHFSGHGSDTGEIMVVGRDGKPHPITAEALRGLFQTLGDGIRVVVLNASHSESQLAGISESIDCVVGMNAEFSEQAGITFAASFYRALGFGRSVQEAFEQGRTALLLEGIPGHDVPQLVVRRGVDSRRIIPVPAVGGAGSRQTITVEGSGNTLYVAGGNIESQAAGPEKQPSTAHPVEDGSGATELVLLQMDDERLFCPATSVTVRGDSVAMVLRPGPADAAFLSGLTSRFGARRLWAAFAESAIHGVAESVERSRAGGEERWSVTIAKDADRGEPMEMGTPDISADQIAELRARRILLDERPPSEASAWTRADPMLDVLVRGLGESRGVERSPLPPLYAAWTGSRTDFLAAARLAAVLALHASHTVEHVLELSIAWSGKSAITVRFHGRRKKVYTNRPAPEIRVEGVCRLGA